MIHGLFARLTEFRRTCRECLQHKDMMSVCKEKLRACSAFRVDGTGDVLHSWDPLLYKAPHTATSVQQTGEVLTSRI